MSGVSGWLIYFGTIIALFYLVVLLAVPRKWLFSLPLLIYGTAMIFIADEVRAEYGSSDLLYSVLDVSAGMALAFVILLPLVEGGLKLALIPFIRTSETRSKIADAAYWVAAGFVMPFVPLLWRTFSRYPGAILMPTLLITAVIGLALFFILRRRGWLQNPLFLLPGYALGVPILLAISLYYGLKVSSAADLLAAGRVYCIESGDSDVVSTWDRTPLTMISRGISEYHAQLIVETAPEPVIYSWSWQTLSFGLVKPDMYLARACSKA